MAKESCWNCSVKMADPVPFCPTCGQPTRHATDTDRLDFDLRQWRAHLERSESNGGGSPRTATRVVDRSSRERIAGAPATVARSPAKGRRRLSMPVIRLPKFRVPQMRPGHAVEAAVSVDVDDPFAYTACATCGGRDWILRGSHNTDGTFNYWCVRCSRAFKTTVRLSHGLKPLVAAGAVLAVPVGMIFLLR